MNCNPLKFALCMLVACTLALSESAYAGGVLGTTQGSSARFARVEKECERATQEHREMVRGGAEAVIAAASIGEPYTTGTVVTVAIAGATYTGHNWNQACNVAPVELQGQMQAEMADQRFEQCFEVQRDSCMFASSGNMQGCFERAFEGCRQTGAPSFSRAESTGFERCRECPPDAPEHPAAFHEGGFCPHESGPPDHSCPDHGGCEHGGCEF